MNIHTFSRVTKTTATTATAATATQAQTGLRSRFFTSDHECTSPSRGPWLLAEPHERQTVARALAECQHHSAQRQMTARVADVKPQGRVDSVPVVPLLHTSVRTRWWKC